MAGAFSLADVLNEATSNNSDLAGRAKAIEQSYSANTEAMGDQAQNTLAYGQKNSQVIAQDEIGKLAAQNNAREIATRLGTNMEVSSQRMVDLAAQIEASYQQANLALDRVHAKNSVGLMDNPIKHFANQLTVGDDIEAYNYAADKHNLAARHMSTLNGLTQESTQTQYAIAATRSAASIQAKSEAELHRTAAIADEIRATNARYNVQQITAVAQMNGQILDNKFRAFNAIEADTQREFMNEQRKMARLEAEERLNMLKDRVAAQKEDTEADNEFVATVNLGATSLGLKPMQKTTLLRLFKQPGEYGNRIRSMYHIGAIQAATGKAQIGSNPGEAARLILSTDAPLAPANKPTAEFLKAAYSDVYSGAGAPGAFASVDKKDAKSIDAAVTKHAINAATNQMKNIKAGDFSNIYQAPDVQSVAKNNLGVAESALYQKVLRPMAAASGVTQMDADPNRMMDITLDAIKSGAISFDEGVTGINTFYRAAVELNRATKEYSKFNLPEPTHANEYMTKMSPAIGMNGQFNMSDPKDVIRYLTLRQIGNGGFGGGAWR